MDTKIPPGLQQIYLADITKPFVLVLRRSSEEDTPLLVCEVLSVLEIYFDLTAILFSDRLWQPEYYRRSHYLNVS
jgi:hypothetical protein